MTELDESIFNILKYSGGKIVLNDDELKIQIPRYDSPEEYSQTLRKINDLKNEVRNIASSLNCHIGINVDHRIDILPWVVNMIKYVNSIVETKHGFTYYILDKSNIDWVKINNIFETLLQALKHRIIDQETYGFIISILHYRINIGDLNIK